MERHLGVTSDDSTRVELQPQSAVLMLRLCLPCAQVNLPKIEEAIVRKVQEIQAEMRQHPSVES